MQALAAAATAAIVLVYFALMRIDPAFTLLQPRGGLVVLGVSLLIANGAIWLARDRHRSLNARFQLAAAGWLWVIVQLGGTVYIYRAA